MIEDDCQSIGPGQITYPQIPTSVRTRIKSIIVPELGGIDHLPDDPQALLTSSAEHAQCAILSFPAQSSRLHLSLNRSISSSASALLIFLKS